MLALGTGVVAQYDALAAMLRNWSSMAHGSRTAEFTDVQPVPPTGGATMSPRCIVASLG